MHLHQDEREDYVKYLVDKFPKCFFEDPEQRLPLKKNIVADLERQCGVGPPVLTQVLGWYESHFSYQRKLLSGAERVDLDGKKAGTVTESEQEAARRKIAARKKEMAERRAALANPPAPVRPPAGNGHAPEGETMSKTATTPPNLPPSLVPLQEAIVTAGSILTDARYEALRKVLATAALKEVVGRAEELIRSLSPDPR